MIIVAIEDSLKYENGDYVYDERPPWAWKDTLSQRLENKEITVLPPLENLVISDMRDVKCWDKVYITGTSQFEEDQLWFLENYGECILLIVDYMSGKGVNIIRETKLYSVMFTWYERREQDESRIKETNPNYLGWFQKDNAGLLIESIIKCVQNNKIDKDFFQPLPYSIFISNLKHRIDHIFLPTVIDLQGIGDELKERGKDSADKYLEDVFKMRISSDFKEYENEKEYFYYRNRLNRARYLAVGHQDADTRKEFRLIGLGDVEKQELTKWLVSGQPEAQLPKGKAMWDLVQETLKSQWEQFIKLLGLCQVNDNTFKCNSASPIQQFMHKVDCLLKEYPKLPELNKVLDFFKQSHDWGSEDMTIHSFGDWFSELADAMDKLRESFPPIDVESM